MIRLFKNAEIAAAGQIGLTHADVLVADGKISQVASGIDAPQGAEVIDCRGKILLPGLFDMHVHLREPGRNDKESIHTGTEAAIKGGITAVVAMPNTSPAIDSGGLVRSVLDIASKTARIPVHVAGAITKGREGKEMAGIAGMVGAGVRMITDDGSPVENPQMLRRAMEYAREFNLLVASHCETKALSGEGAMNEGSVSYRFGIPGIPAMSEEICIARDIAIARHTRCRLHILHVTTARGLETVRRAKNDGVNVTCEVTPHHLIFDENDIVDYDANFKVNPPLRTTEDRAALLAGLSEGVIDVIATDHAPHTAFEKHQQDFGNAPFGITGLETALPSLFHHFIAPGKLDWGLLVEKYSAKPRELMGLDPVEIVEGNLAELVIFDPAGQGEFTKQSMRSKASNTPFLDKTLGGTVQMVIVGDLEL
ncbi:MAG: dihydroorotase [Verrucomicrobiales bacterium]|jgi:dihydroorotase